MLTDLERAFLAQTRTDADALRVAHAKRKAVLADGERFFNFDAGAHDLRAQAAFRFVAASLAAADRGDVLTSLQVCGELFGGHYPHAVCLPDAGAPDAAVQTGVWYSPRIAFCCFDMRATVASGASWYLGFDQLTRACAHSGLMCVEALGRGALHELHSAPVDFATTIPRRLGLPDVADNWAEGIVLRPVEPVYTRDGKHVQLKRKPARFAEDARFHAAVKPMVGGGGGGGGVSGCVSSGGSVGGVASALDVCRFEVLALVNPNRLDAAVSKVGRLSRDTAKPVLAELVADVWTSYREAFGVDGDGDECAALEADVELACKQLIIERLQRK